MKLLVDAHLFDEQHQGTRTYLKGLYSELIPIAKDWHFFLVAHDIENLKSEFGNILIMSIVNIILFNY